MKEISFDEIIEVVNDKSRRKNGVVLYTNTIYKNRQPYKNLSDVVLPPLMEVKNQGGFRPIGEYKNNFDVKYVVLFSNGSTDIWSDKIDLQNRTYTYYGDNKKPGNPLLETNLGGNRILKKTFELAKGNKEDKKKIPPFFLFEQRNQGVEFVGLLVPANYNNKELVVEKINTENGVIENYKAIFSMIDLDSGIDLRWLADLKESNGYDSEYAPIKWKKWVEENSESSFSGIYEEVKSNIEQLENHYIKTIYEDNDRIVIYEEPLKIRQYVEKDEKQETSRKRPDYVANEAIKVAQGEKNEEAIYKYELMKLMQQEADEQVRKMKEFFENRNDTEGYDILSFELVEGEYVEKYIEVKSTQSSDEGTPIDITKNEIEFAKKHKANYYLYRIINSNSKNRYVKIINGEDLFKNYFMIPTSYKIYGTGDL